MNKKIISDDLKVFICDVDGVLNTGQFLYHEEGKVYKIFGPDDADAVKILSKFMPIEFVSGDFRGWGITEKRIKDMNQQVTMVSTYERINWIKERYDPYEVIYMGDGLLDYVVMQKVGYAITTNDAYCDLSLIANYITHHKGGYRAVAEACMHILSLKYGRKLEDDLEFELRELMK